MKEGVKPGRLKYKNLGHPSLENKFGAASRGSKVRLASGVQLG